MLQVRPSNALEIWLRSVRREHVDLPQRTGGSTIDDLVRSILDDRPESTLGQISHKLLY
jgi:hypothetical protein